MANQKNTYESQIAGLKLELTKKKNDRGESGGGVNIGGNVSQKTSGHGSPNSISGRDTIY
ncbi:MAG: hypothetical protein HQK96_10155 [Nitrospirae bacterium]|nr:hypothetical protein [Nitrospirota bacterium]